MKTQQFCPNPDCRGGLIMKHATVTYPDGYACPTCGGTGSVSVEIIEYVKRGLICEEEEIGEKEIYEQFGPQGQADSGAQAQVSGGSNNVPAREPSSKAGEGEEAARKTPPLLSAQDLESPRVTPANAGTARIGADQVTFSGTVAGSIPADSTAYDLLVRCKGAVGKLIIIDNKWFREWDNLSYDIDAYLSKIDSQKGSK